MQQILDETRQAFLAVIADRRVSFGRDHAAKFNAFCHEQNYRQRWPAEALRLAQDETRARGLELKSRLADAIEAGWKPTPAFTVAQAIQYCFAYNDFEEDPTSDLRDFVRAAFDQVGLGSTQADLDKQQRDLGAAQVRVYKLMLHDLDITATKRYGSYRAMEYNEAFRFRVLQSLYEHFTANQEHVFTVGVLQRLNIENNVENLRLVGNALLYWHQKHAIKATEARGLHMEFPHVAVTAMTSSGIDRIEGLNQQTAAVHNNYHLNGSTVGVIGTMTGGVVNQNIGATFADLATALEQLRNEMSESDDPFAPAVEATAEKAVSLARADAPDRSALERVLTGLGQTVQSIAAVPQAWAFIALEGAKAGFNIPGPPTTPSLGGW